MKKPNRGDIQLNGIMRIMILVFYVAPLGLCLVSISPPTSSDVRSIIPRLWRCSSLGQIFLITDTMDNLGEVVP